MTEHAKFPPSASKRWIHCPGSITLAESLSEGPPSSYALEGTRCHEIAADCLRKIKVPGEYLGQNIEGVTITQELVDAISMYIDEVRSTASDMQVNGGKVEFKVDITPDCWGTVDAALWNNDLLTIIDAKFGKGVIVQAEDNPQMKLYAIGMLKTLKATDVPLPKQVTMKIVQPRTVDPVRECTMTVNDLQIWAKDILAPALERLRNGDTTCNPGEEQCRWCGVSPVCTAQARSMLNKAAEAFAPFTQKEPPEIATGSDLLDVRARAILALSFKAIEDWMKSIRDDLSARALAGEEIPFFKLVEGRSVRRWADEEGDLVEFLESNGIDPYEQRLKTPPAVEKEIGKKTAKEIELEEHIIKPPGDPTLVPETDKRPAIEQNVEKHFEEFVKPEPVDPKPIDDGTIIIGGVDDAEPFTEGMSLSQRMARLAGAEPELKSPVPADVVAPSEMAENEQMVEEIATGGDHEPPEQEEGIVEFVEAKGGATPPSAPKRKQVLDLADGTLTLNEIAVEIGSTDNQVRMHLRYLNERDGYGYTIYQDGRVLVEA